MRLHIYKGVILGLGHVELPAEAQQNISIGSLFQSRYVA